MSADDDKKRAAAYKKTVEARNRNLVQPVIDENRAHSSQAEPKAGFIRYELIGGTWAGATVRLYPPYTDSFVWNGETYMLTGPKNGQSPKLTYTAKEAATQ